MNRTFLLALLILVSALTAVGKSRLEPQGTATRLIVDDKPFVIIGGETGNSMGS